MAQLTAKVDVDLSEGDNFWVRGDCIFNIPDGLSEADKVGMFRLLAGNIAYQLGLEDWSI